jgi:geranylgeranyl diphosphate synthase type II
MKIPELLPYYQKIEKAILQEIKKLQKEKSPLVEACSYSLLSGGKRFRPLLVVLVAKSLKKNHNVFPIALSVEFFHTASLIADDLPCMDNEETRRNRPTVHKVFGESTALLASYTLIALAYEMIEKNCFILRKERQDSDRLCEMALAIVSRSAGVCGVTGGQYLDLHPSDQSLKTLLKIIEQKTITLFESAFLLGWLFGGGDLKKLPFIKKAAYHFGMAFQMLDDLQDQTQDKKNSAMNIANLLGTDETLSRIKREIHLFEKSLKLLGIYSQEFQTLLSYFNKGF